MALSEQDSIQILSAIRREMKNRNLQHIDERIMRDMGAHAEHFSELMRYLQQLAGEFRLGGASIAEVTLERLRAHARSANGEEIRGFRIELSPADARRYQQESIEFLSRPGLDQLEHELKELMSAIEKERFRERKGPDIYPDL